MELCFRCLWLMVCLALCLGAVARQGELLVGEMAVWSCLSNGHLLPGSSQAASIQNGWGAAGFGGTFWAVFRA